VPADYVACGKVHRLLRNGQGASKLEPVGQHSRAKCAVHRLRVTLARGNRRGAHGDPCSGVLA
jgi:hypothetical protein